MNSSLQSFSHQIYIVIREEAQTRPVKTGILSPILQVDGEAVVEDLAKYSFLSIYAEEDILYSLDDIYPGQRWFVL